MSEFQQLLSKYAELVVKIGVNIQKGQTLVVNGTIDSAELVRLIVKKSLRIRRLFGQSELDRRYGIPFAV